MNIHNTYIYTFPFKYVEAYIFQDTGLDQYVQYTKIIEPQSVPYAINYVLTTTSLQDEEPLILAFTRRECNSGSLMIIVYSL